jgi:hypothetical protein
MPALFDYIPAMRAMQPTRCLLASESGVHAADAGCAYEPCHVHILMLYYIANLSSIAMPSKQGTISIDFGTPLLGVMSLNTATCWGNSLRTPSPYVPIIMAVTSSQGISMMRISSSEALKLFVQSFSGLPKHPPFLYLSATSHNLVVYIAPLQTVNVISFSYLTRALDQGNESATILKRCLETSAATKVFFDARKAAKLLFDCCGIRLTNPVCFTSPNARNHTY